MSEIVYFYQTGESFLPSAKRTPSPASDWPTDLGPLIHTEAAKLQNRRGEPYPVSASGQRVMLGTTR